MFENRHRNDHMKSFKIDPALYHFMCDGVCKGLSGSYVEDLLRTGEQDFRRVSKETNTRFEMAEDRMLPSEFCGFVIVIDNNGNFVIDQNSHLRRLGRMPTIVTFSHFKST